jgi:Tfp pilus assembly protein PilE
MMMVVTVILILAAISTPFYRTAEVREKFQEIATPLVQLRHTWQTIHPPFRRRFERLLLPAGFVSA